MMNRKGPLLAQEMEPTDQNVGAIKGFVFEPIVRHALMDGFGR